MATRFYLPATGIAPISPAFDGSWEATGAPTRRPLETQKVHLSPQTEVGVAEAVNNTAYDVAVAQFISAPLNGNQTISGNIKGIIRARESNAAADMRAQMVIRVLSGDGSTVRGTLIASDGAALGNEFTSGGTARNCKYPKGWTGTGQTPTSVNALDGDRIVIEVGYRSHEASATSRTGTLVFGDAEASDAAENETDTTDSNPWVEFADTLSFDASDLRVSQHTDLVATKPTPDLRVSQHVDLVAAKPLPDLRVSQHVVLVAVPPPTTLRVSQHVVLVAVGAPPPASGQRFWASVIS
jgi:hypothetical protein